MDTNVQTAKQQLLDDFGKVVTDAEELLKAVRGAPGERVAEMRASVEERLTAAKARLHGIQSAAAEKTTAVARATDEYVHENAWTMIGAGVAIGFVLGLVLRSVDRD